MGSNRKKSPSASIGTVCLVLFSATRPSVGLDLLISECFVFFSVMYVHGGPERCPVVAFYTDNVPCPHLLHLWRFPIWCTSFRLLYLPDVSLPCIVKNKRKCPRMALIILTWIRCDSQYGPWGWLVAKLRTEWATPAKLKHSPHLLSVQPTPSSDHMGSSETFH